MLSDTRPGPNCFQAKGERIDQLSILVTDERILKNDLWYILSFFIGIFYIH